MESEKKLVKDINIRWFDNEIVIEPASGKHEITFIWFHHIYKNAIDPASFLIRGPTLQFENARIVLPQAPSRIITADTDKTPKPTWFDILSRDFTKPVEEVISIKDLKEVEAEMQSIIEREVKLLNGDGSRIFLAGFAQGAAMALTVGLQSKEKLGGIFAVEGYFISTTEVNESNKDTPVLVILGKVPPEYPWDPADGVYKDYEKTFDSLQSKKSSNTTVEVKEGTAYFDRETMQNKFVDFIKPLIKKP